MNNVSYHKAIALLLQVSTKNGFLASAENTSNYQRVWARDGVICGLAALASADEKLIATFKKTLETLADNGGYTKDPEILTEYVRQSLSRQITQQYLSLIHI